MPGEKLRIEHMKDDYGVGGATLREALSLLISDALVVSQGQRGFRVAPVSLEDLADITETRVMLEGEALLVHRGLEVGLFASELNRDTSVGVDISVK